jgi:hypothetical protein
MEHPFSRFGGHIKIFTSVVTALLIAVLCFHRFTNGGEKNPAVSSIDTSVGPNATNQLLSNRTFIDAVISTPEKMPRASTIPQLSEAEEQFLISACGSLSNPTNRFGILATLAFGGRERSAEYLRWMLEEEFSGRTLTHDEASVLYVTARLLGVLGQRATGARTLLIKGTQMEHWRRRALWRVDWDHYYVPRFLANNCVQGCGLLPDAKNVLRELTQGGLQGPDAVTLSGAVVTAAAYASAIEEFGREKFFDQIFMQHPEWEYYAKWKTRDEASPWLRWSEEVTKASVR